SKSPAYVWRRNSLEIILFFTSPICPELHHRRGISCQLIFAFAISSHAALGGAPRLGRVTQPGFRNSTFPRLSFRGTWVCPCTTTSTSSGEWLGKTC